MLAITCIAEKYIIDVDAKYDQKLTKYISKKDQMPISGELIGYYKDSNNQSYNELIDNGKVIFTTYFYESGTKKAEKDYLANTYKEYYESGNLKSACNLINGFKLDGIYKHYAETGELEYQITGDTVIFADDFRIDNNIIVKFFYPSGELKIILKKEKEKTTFYESYFNDGHLHEKGIFKNGDLVKLEQFFESGELAWKTIHKSNGMSEMTQYYQDGKIAAEITLKNDKAISGQIYNQTGKKSRMTSAHFYNMGIKY